MKDFGISPQEAVSSFWRNRGLIAALVKREVIGRYRGSVIGILWSFLQPVFMLAIYTFVFSVVFKARWSVQSDSKAEFALVLFAGLLVYNLFAECVTKAPSLIVSNVNYVKKVIFPLEILPWVVVGSALFHAVIGLLVWLLAYGILIGWPQPTALLTLFVLVPLVLFIVGLVWILASLGVYLRDVAQFIGVIATTLLFLSPVFYPATALPEEYRYILFLNPLTPAIEQIRNVLFWGYGLDMPLLFVCFVAALVIAWLGFAWFQKTRKGFADVL